MSAPSIVLGEKRIVPWWTQSKNVNDCLLLKIWRLGFNSVFWFLHFDLGGYVSDGMINLYFKSIFCFVKRKCCVEPCAEDRFFLIFNFAIVVADEFNIVGTREKFIGFELKYSIHKIHLMTALTTLHRSRNE